MKKLKMTMNLVVMFLVISCFVFPIQAEAKIDMSVFENNKMYTVAYDEMEGNTVISISDMEEDCGSDMFIGGASDDTTSKWAAIGTFNILEVEDQPAVLIMTVYLISEEARIDCNKVILKSDDARYYFEVDSKSEGNSTDSYRESFNIVFTDESIGILRDMYKEDETDSIHIKVRFKGNEDYDGELVFDKGLKKMYNDYVASGGLEQDFTLLKQVFPSEVKYLN